jgi:hypothetical protein
LCQLDWVWTSGTEIHKVNVLSALREDPREVATNQVSVGTTSHTI